MKGTASSSSTSSLPKFARAELEDLSIKELKGLLPNGDNYKAADRSDLLDHLITSGAVDLVDRPPVELSMAALHKMSIAQLKQCMNEQAGLFYDSRAVVEKKDMIQLFVDSGRLCVLSDDEDDNNDKMSKQEKSFFIPEAAPPRKSQPETHHSPAGKRKNTFNPPSTSTRSTTSRHPPPSPKTSSPSRRSRPLSNSHHVRKSFNDQYMRAEDIVQSQHKRSTSYRAARAVDPPLEEAVDFDELRRCMSMSQLGESSRRGERLGDSSVHEPAKKLTREESLRFGGSVHGTGKKSTMPQRHRKNGKLGHKNVSDDSSVSSYGNSDVDEFGGESGAEPESPNGRKTSRRGGGGADPPEEKGTGKEATLKKTKKSKEQRLLRRQRSERKSKTEPATQAAKQKRKERKR